MILIQANNQYQLNQRWKMEDVNSSSKGGDDDEDDG